MEGRAAPAVHARRETGRDPGFEVGLSQHLLGAYGHDGLVELYGRFVAGTGELDAVLRRAVWRALAERCGSGLVVEPGVGFRHPETFAIGANVFLGADAVVQGHVDGRCRIGSHTWVGPQSFLDGRDLVIANAVGVGPGVRILTSAHVELPADIPVIATEVRVTRVHIGRGADVGTGAVILPGVTVGAGAVVGAASLVNRNVAPGAVVAGSPARFVRWRRHAKS
ncbi:MAG: N-acetyltransferase [Actinomycetota bacterium]|nr:N-acetyltransferase [Actinomycetota bacterium]